MYGALCKVGLIVPANNSVIEPELWGRAPPGVAFYATRLLAQGDLTENAVKDMERSADRAVRELAATGVNVIVYADMVTTFIMQPDWNDERTNSITEVTGIACISAWTALREALASTGVSRFALGTPYPVALHALIRPYFEKQGIEVTDDATLDLLAMRDVPKVTDQELTDFVYALDLTGAEALVLLATDLPTFRVIETFESDLGLPVLSSNQSILWSALRRGGFRGEIEGIGRLGRLQAGSPALSARVD